MFGDSLGSEGLLGDMLGFEGFFCDSLGSEGLFGDSLGRAGAADDFGLGRCGLSFRPYILEARIAYQRCCIRFRVRALRFRPSGLCTSQSALLISDAAYDLGFGRFGFSFRPCELEARFAS